ncbi:MAG TPA: hypothetical protein VGK39_01370 [Cyclobacteriaceae bacterium]
MARFNPGQDIVCVYDEWFAQNGCNIGSRVFGRMPKKNEIVTVERYVRPNHMYLVGFNTDLGGGRLCFEDDCFEPLMDITELTEILESVPESV